MRRIIKGKDSAVGDAIREGEVGANKGHMVASLKRLPPGLASGSDEGFMFTARFIS
jgi:hypothetical protein